MSDTLEQFIANLSGLLESKPTESELLPKCGKLLEALVSSDDWLDEKFQQPHPDHYCQYLLHLDPGGRFSVVSFVWGAGQETPIHDHRVWGAIGMLRGAETGTAYIRDAKTGMLIEGETLRLEPGMVDFVSPRLGDIHKVRNAFDDRVSISIHVYGADIGSVERHVYDPQTGARNPFVSGYTSLN